MFNRQLQRDEQTQRSVDEQTKCLVLYYYAVCPFCIRVMRAIDRLNLNIELRDILMNRDYRDELIKQGGRSTVPCLRISHLNDDDQWMYESRDIIAYLNEEFSDS